MGFVLSLLASIVPVLLWLNRKVDGSEYYYWYGFADKKWLSALYFIWVIGFPILVMVLISFRPSPKAVSHTELDPDEGPSVVGREVSYKILAGCLLLIPAWLIWGPPWKGPSLHGPVDIHEAVHLKGYQAILSGSQPYVGAANEQYGPLAQRFVASWWIGVGQEALSSTRVAYAALNFGAVLFILVSLLIFLRLRTAVAAAVVGMFLVPHFTFFSQTQSGLAGFFGWANLWRYAGVLFLGLSLPWLLHRIFHSHKIVAVKSGITRSFSLGVVWGVTTLIAQENLLGGLLVLVVIGATLVVVLRLPILSSSVLGAGVLAGLVVVWLVYLIPYLGAGTVRDFIGNYFLVPLAVSAGYSGSYWQSSSPWTALFYFGPLVLMLIGLLLAVGLRYLSRPAQRSSTLKVIHFQSWAAAFGLFVAATVALSSSLNRSDTSHLFNSGWILPFAVIAFVVFAIEVRQVVPTFANIASVGTVVMWLISLMLGTESLFPLAPAIDRFTSAIKGRVNLVDWKPPESLGRMDGPLEANSPAFPGELSVTRKEIQDFSSELKLELGDVPTYVDQSINVSTGALTTGYWYFAADLRPVEIPFEEDAVVITETQREANLEALREPETRICGLVTANPETDQATAVLERGGFNLISQIPLAGQPISVYRCES